ncbi:MAG: C1 family peptidase, partial [Pseudomonadota bacterium]
MRLRSWFYVLFCLVVMVVYSGLFGSAALADYGQYATGLKEPTAAQLQWMTENFPVIKKVHLNDIAFERINAERQAKGLRKLLRSELDIVAIGEEAESGSATISSTVSATYGVLPGSVDNSQSPAFPPIRSQGGVGSCVAWATTYYQFTYENNLLRDRAASRGDNSVIFSPKWTYNMINGGVDAGAYFSDAYVLLQKHGAVSWAEFPYDYNYLAWCLNTEAWRNAINYRPLSWGRLYNTDTSILIGDIKTQLANGHVLVVGTYVYSWVSKTISNDPSSSEDDAFVGQRIASYMKNTYSGGHAMTVVGYNDIIWCDLNGNARVDSGEKGAFKIANSWGTGDWNGGYRWVTYDSLRGTSAVPATGTWPTSDRYSSGIFLGSNIYTMTVRPDYTPSMVAEFTLSHLKRGQLRMSLGTGGASTVTPTSTWYPEAVYSSGGNYAFNGTTTACDATFVFDFSELPLPAGGQGRWFVGMYDGVAGAAATIK